VQADVALVFDYEAKWLFEVQPQGADFHYPRFAFEYYSALRALGLDVDIVPAHAPLDGYKLVVVPPLPVVPDDFADRLARSGAQVVLGPRTGSKTRDLQIPSNLPPGALADLLSARVWRVESLRPNVDVPVVSSHAAAGAKPFAGVGRHWRDLIDTGTDGERYVSGAEVRATFGDGHPAWVRRGRVNYLASLFDDALTAHVFAQIAGESGLNVTAQGESVRVSRRGGLTYVFNYGEATHTVDGVDASAFVLGSRDVEPQGVAAYRTPA
jgi:beta-galactosidase